MARSNVSTPPSAPVHPSSPVVLVTRPSIRNLALAGLVVLGLALSASWCGTSATRCC
jgi:hypothetical protein